MIYFDQGVLVASVACTPARNYCEQFQGHCHWALWDYTIISGPEKGVITKGVFSLEESLESLISKFSRISRNWSDSPLFSTVCRILLCFPQSGDRISRKWTFLKRPLFQKDPFFRTRKYSPRMCWRKQGAI